MPRLRSTENGSLPLALLVAIIVAGLVVVLIARTLTAQRQVQYDQAFHGALPPAEAGGEITKFRLNNSTDLMWENAGGTVEARDPSEFEVGDFTVPETQQIDGIDYTWFATRGDGHWRVDTTAVDDAGRSTVDRHTVVTLRESPLVDLAAFADVFLNLSGSNTADSYNSETKEWCTGNGLTGSNGAVVFQATGSGGDCPAEHAPNNGHELTQRSVDGVTLYDFDPDAVAGVTEELPGGYRCGQAGGGPIDEDDPVNSPDHANCKELQGVANATYPGPENQTYLRPVTDPEERDLATNEAIAFMQDAFDLCNTLSGDETQGDFEASDFDTGGVATISPAVLPSAAGQVMSAIDFPMDRGSFSCWDNAYFDMDTVVDTDRDDPVVMFVKGDVIMRGSPGPGGQRVDVNCGGAADGVDDDQCLELDLADGFPIPDRLWIFVQGGGSVQVRNQSNFAGVIWAPRALCEGAPSGASSAQVDIYGSMICSTISNQGGWAFHYDDILGETGDGDFYRSQWAEAEQQAVPGG